jgi:ATP-dependent helicase/DNAse subunit B
MVHNIAQPSIPLPSIFTQIASLLKNHYDGKHTSELHVDIPPGAVSHGEKSVRSQIIQLPNHNDTCYISGRFDIVVSFEDGTYGVIDFKTSNPNTESANLYSRQLHAYAYALEHPDPGALTLYPVTRLGLLYFYPSRVNQQSIEQLSYEADITWVEIKKDEPSFLNFIDELLDVLESPVAPEHSPNCPWCKYTKKLSSI